MTSQQAYHRTFAWWILIQSWGILRFDDCDRPPHPLEDHWLRSRRLFPYCLCKCLAGCLRENGLLKVERSFRRRFSLPSLSTNCTGCLQSELRYHSAFAMQSRLHYSLQIDASPICSMISTSFWTPHSSRIFHPVPRWRSGYPKRNATTSADGVLRAVTGTQEWQLVLFPISSGSPSKH